MPRVLVLTYYWPPSGGAGVQRWLKFVKYLHRFNWEPIVYTVDGGELPSMDNSLVKDVPQAIEILKQPIWEPYEYYKKFLGQKKGEKINAGFLAENKKPGLLEELSVWIRGNFFIPDARMFWINPSVKYLEKYLLKNPIDLIVSTGPPHSTHLIALKLKKKLSLKWVADFRDPWTKIDFYKELKLTFIADRRHKNLEKKVLQNADRVITIGKVLGKELEVLSNREVDIVPNGFDPEDTRGYDCLELDKEFSISHIGTLVKSRNHPVFWKAIGELIEELPDFKNYLKIKIVGKLDYSASKDIERIGLWNYVEKVDYLPHNEVMKVQMTSQVLLLSVNNTHNSKGILTGKIYEYLNARRPIFAIGPPDGDLAGILRHTNSGIICDFEDKEGMKKGIRSLFDDYMSGNQTFRFRNIEEFDRKKLTKDLINIFEEVLD